MAPDAPHAPNASAFLVIDLRIDRDTAVDPDAVLRALHAVADLARDRVLATGVRTGAIVVRLAPVTAAATARALDAATALVEAQLGTSTPRASEVLPPVDGTSPSDLSALHDLPVLPAVP